MLQVPVHQALQCRIEAYGTPFAAPDLKTSNPTDNDMEYASCIAAQPELEEQPSFNISRMASMLERNTLVTRNTQLGEQQVARYVAKQLSTSPYAAWAPICRAFQVGAAAVASAISNMI